MWGDGESSAGDPAAEGRSDGETATGNRGPDYDTDVTPRGGA
jgi:hypothetical protein